MKKPTTARVSGFWGYARSYLHDYLPKVRGASPRTIEAYRISLENYVHSLIGVQDVPREEISFDHFNRELLKGWVNWMQETKNYQPRTVRLRLTSIKAFLHYVSAEDIVLMAVDESARTVKTPTAARKPVDYLEAEQKACLLAAYGGETLNSRRNRMLLVMLYDTAARVSELTALTLADISFVEPVCATLTGKRGKSRIVPLSSKTVEHLEVYLAQFHPGAERRQGQRPLFYSRCGGHETALSADAVSLVLKNAGDKARLRCPSMPEHLYCHMLRKTKAMDLYRQGVALPLIMQLLGHENMSTTSSFYAFATLDMMRAAMAAGSPAVDEVQQTPLSREDLD